MNTEFFQNELSFFYKYLSDFFKNIDYNPHHLDHLLRVTKNALNIGRKMDANLVVLEVSALFHDIARADEKEGLCHAKLSADYTRKMLVKRNWPLDIISEIVYAIENHRYRKGITPKTLEAKILQDADRLDALGAFGIIRVFQHNPKQQLYNIADPSFENRKTSDAITIDHFYDKILKLIDGFYTEEAYIIAKPRHDFILNFLEELKTEL